MVQPRAIPCLSLMGEGLVKTERFSKPRYIGDPINAVKLFNDLEADELLFLDIRASAEGRSPDFARIEAIAGEAFMPIGYGGGVRSIDDARRLFRLGVEKVLVTTAASERPSLVTELAAEFGSQSIVAGIDVKRDWRRRACAVVRAGSTRVSTDVVAYARELERLGAGEIVLTSVDRDGTMSGYDLELIGAVASAVTIPVVACGGAGSLADLRSAVERGAAAAAAGSLFVYAGPHRAVMISYPSAAQLTDIFSGVRP